MINLFTKKNNMLVEKENFRQKAIKFGRVYLKIAIAMYVLFLGYSLLAKHTEIDTTIFNYAFPENEMDVDEIGKYLVEYISQSMNQKTKNVTFIKNIATSRKNENLRSGKTIYSYEVSNVTSEILIQWEYNGEYKIINSEIIK